MCPDDGVTSGSDSVYVLTPGHQAAADKKDTYQLSLNLSLCVLDDGLIKVTRYVEVNLTVSWAHCS